MDGWNIGTPPYGYTADRIPHPVPFKAAQGRTKSRLALDPDRAPVIAQMYTWRTVDKLGCPAIAARLNADPASYPPPNPATGWTAQNVRVMLANPKYTGHMVYGRHRNRNGRRTPAPQDQWLWSPAPVHPAIVDRATWDAAQDIAAGHGTSRDGDEPNTHPATLRFYPYRSRIRCRDCRRRMAGSTYGNPGAQSTYYRCPHDPATPKHAASCPDHPRTVQAPELLLDEIVGRFFADRIFGPGRAELLAAQLPATDADAAARPGRPGRPAPGPHQADRDRAELPDPRTRTTPRRPGRHRSRRHARPHPRPLRRPSPRTRADRNPARRPGQDHPGRRRPRPARRTPGPGGHPARSPARPQSPPVRRVRPGNPVEQARPASHRVRGDHREHPPGHPRHHRPRTRRLPRHQHRDQHRRHRPHVGSGQHP